MHNLISLVGSLKLAAKGTAKTLHNPDAFSTTAAKDDYFGYSVAASSDYVVVGAHQEDDAGGADSGKVYIFNATTGTLLRTLDNPNAYSSSGGDYFGYSVGISGGYVIVGAYGEADVGGTQSGKAYIFDVVTGALHKTLTNPNAYSTGGGDQFGWSVAISGGYAIVGASQEDDAGGSQSGKAYIFDVATGALHKTLNNPNAHGTPASDNFGCSVAISGNYAIVGAYFEDDAGGTDSGKAYIFDVATGALHKTLNNPNPQGTSISDYFGYSVAISGNYAVVGAYKEDDSASTEVGKAYIFDVATGTLLRTLHNPNGNGSGGADFGFAVAVDGSTALIGSRQDGYGGYSIVGRAHLFDVTTGAHLATIANPNAYGTSGSDYFGSTVALGGGHAVVGAHQEDDDGGTSSGKAYIFDAATGVLRQTLNNPNGYGTTAAEQFGYAVAIDGNYAIVGSRYEDDAGGADSGKAYIFNVTTGLLHRTLDNPNAYGTSVSDAFGSAVALGGNYAIVGVPSEDASGGSNSGKAYIFDVGTGSLLRTLSNPNAYGTVSNDLFGYSVAISGDYAIVGAYGEGDSGGSGSGKAYIFNVATGALHKTLNNPNAYSTSLSDNFGISVAISGSYAIVGAYAEDDLGGSGSGKAYIFNVTTGALHKTLDNPNAYGTSAQDSFGWSVAISGGYAIVGASQEDEAGGGNSGKVYVFDVATGSLLRTLSNPNAYGTPTSDSFGRAIGLSGTRAIAGASSEGDAGGTYSGKAYVFDVTTGALLQTLDNPNGYGTSASDSFGHSVAISGDYALAGAYNEDDSGGGNSGKAYLIPI